MKTVATDYPPTPPVKWGRLLVIIAIVVGIPAGVITCNTLRRPFLDWSERRDAWLARCGPDVAPEHRRPQAYCDRDGAALLAEARANGWAK